MPLEPRVLTFDPRVLKARKFMELALDLLDQASCLQVAAILDHAINALGDKENYDPYLTDDMPNATRQ